MNVVTSFFNSYYSTSTYDVVSVVVLISEQVMLLRTCSTVLNIGWFGSFQTHLCYYPHCSNKKWINEKVGGFNCGACWVGEQDKANESSSNKDLSYLW